MMVLPCGSYVIQVFCYFQRKLKGKEVNCKININKEENREEKAMIMVTD